VWCFLIGLVRLFAVASVPDLQIAGTPEQIQRGASGQFICASVTHERRIAFDREA
jgi:hypothetical protein